ncbi:hypothetical protein LCE44_27535 [Vibrio harveyi]|jgi:hypothetical protein|uniref:hypothetical protein n=1 Tax=Vibrio harveyi group TaxID=717610 RepID=UPI00030CF3E3|nr:MULTISPECIES: hypothetical protein [Vibrio harveyi group]EKO3823574.1 hypothetical protein [Vibrio harveyi]ELH7813073.1 hypothetical protein [Vibrio harveyi]ELI6428519.1 hypothetical protein [Vibrio harveyi]MCR9819739.1 hypothetical protein [Vibrio parahaemolyticus]MCR9831924.1 hypothetical protein [Vibrio parahaemolyticus]
MSVEFESLSPKEQLEFLIKLEEKGERLKPKQRALKNRLEKEFDSSDTSPQKKDVKTNFFGKVSTSTVNPKAVRFLQKERDLLTERTNSLNTNSPHAVVDRLGSLKAVNDTSLIRAAVLALVDMDDETLIEYIKQTQLNMIGSGNKS